MNNILAPLLAILAIIIPLVVAYVIVTLQERKPVCNCRKESASNRAAMPQNGEGLSHAEEKSGVRFCRVRELF